MPRTIEKVAFPVPKQVKAVRVAAYARVSSGKDAMLHSLSAQVSYYSNYIQNHPGWLYCGVYADEALTGTKDSRENFQRLLTDCRNGKIDLIITKSIARFARNTVTLLESVRELRQLGVDVFFEEQNLHTVGADGELILTILASYAQEESRSASENQKWRIRKGFMEGELVNLRFMYGYTVSRDGVRINPAEAEIVREIFRRAIAGDSLTSIADDLNRRGISGLRGGRWVAQRIREVLSNEKYTGNALLMKHYINNHLEKKRVKNNGEQPMYYAEGTHEAIIDMETFNKAQLLLKRLDEEAKLRTPLKHTAFTSLIRCENCGHNYKRCVNKGIAYWNCQNYVKNGKNACPGCRIHETMLYEIAESVAPFEDIRQIAAGNNKLTFFLSDGSTVCREWHLRSRSESWTVEMKQAARERAIKQRS